MAEALGGAFLVLICGWLIWTQVWGIDEDEF